MIWSSHTGRLREVKEPDRIGPKNRLVVLFRNNRLEKASVNSHRREWPIRAVNDPVVPTGVAQGVFQIGNYKTRNDIGKPFLLQEFINRFLVTDVKPR